MSRNEAFSAGHGRIVARLATDPEHSNRWATSQDDWGNPTISSSAIVDLPSGTQAHISHSSPYQTSTDKKGKPVYDPDSATARVKLISAGNTEPFHEFGIENVKTLKSAVTGAIKEIQNMAQGRKPMGNYHPGNVSRQFPWATTNENLRVSVQFKPEDIEAHAAKLKQERGW